jgi:hypothetical protein
MDFVWFMAFLFRRLSCVLFGHGFWARVGECQFDGSLFWGWSCGYCETFKRDPAPGVGTMNEGGDPQCPRS